jgi:hypothetical protein
MRRIFLVASVILAVVIQISTPTPAADFFINAQTGADANPGARASPWSTTDRVYFQDTPTPPPDDPPMPWKERAQQSGSLKWRPFMLTVKPITLSLQIANSSIR